MRVAFVKTKEMLMPQENLSINYQSPIVSTPSYSSVENNERLYSNGLKQNLNYQGKLSEKELTKIIENYDVYKMAADDAQVPWQAVAAVHFRESNLSTSTIPHGGPFQFDPPRYQGEEDFAVGAKMAARHLQEKSGYRLSPDTKEDLIIKDAFWGYNGRAYGSHNQSPYVMNQFDGAHQDMKIKGSVINNQGKRVHVDHPDTRMGAFTFYNELLEAFL